MMRVTLSVPPNKRDLDRALAFALGLAMDDLRRHRQLPRIYRSGVRYAREPAGVENWAMPSETFRQGWGDCDDLALWAAAALRLRGIKARVVVKRTGPRLWHAVVRLPNGRILDPSKRLGMRGRG